MRIDERAAPQAAGQAAKATPRANIAGAFSVAAELAPAPDAAKPASTQATNGVSALFQLQMETYSPIETRKRAVRRGTKLLDRLDKLKADLLIGADGDTDWDALAAEFAVPRDPNLPREVSALLDEVDVRVAVELAKRGR